MTEVLKGNKLVKNILHFARLLRATGIPVSTDKIVLALRALASVPIDNRDDVFHTLHTVFLGNQSQSVLFSSAFDIFWSLVPSLLNKEIEISEFNDHPAQNTAEIVPRRLSSIVFDSDDYTQLIQKRVPNKANLKESSSRLEILRSRDFTDMSNDELEMVRNAMPFIELPSILTRRFKSNKTGKVIDMRNTLRNSISSSNLINLKFKKLVCKDPGLVILCDISGSMESYARIMLYFFHGVSNKLSNVSTFLFGTRLTNVTHYFKSRDPDEALKKIGGFVKDWHGGTQIGSAITYFNKFWARRTLGQGSIVILITDGLDRDGGAGLAKQMQKLQKSCSKLIWLNPLLGYDGFEAKSVGIKAMLPHVDEFQSCHNLNSLISLAKLISEVASFRGQVNKVAR